MDKKYLQFGKASVFRDTSRNGMLFQFLTEYKNQFNTGKLNPSCSSCREEYWNNYLKLFKMSKPTSNYILKERYNGINLTPTGQPLRNGEMTDKEALELLKKHPRGVELFSKIPEKKQLEEPLNLKNNGSQSFS